MHTGWAAMIALGTAAALAGCASPPIPQGGLPYDTATWGLTAATTTRYEVHTKLGEPAAVYENGGVEAYRFVYCRVEQSPAMQTAYYRPVRDNPSGPFVTWTVAPPPDSPGARPRPVDYTLVIRFGPDDRIVAMNGTKTNYIPWGAGREHGR